MYKSQGAGLVAQKKIFLIIFPTIKNMDNIHLWINEEARVLRENNEELFEAISKLNGQAYEKPYRKKRERGQLFVGVVSELLKDHRVVSTTVNGFEIEINQSILSPTIEIYVDKKFYNMEELKRLFAEK